MAWPWRCAASVPSGRGNASSLGTRFSGSRASRRDRLEDDRGEGGAPGADTGKGVGRPLPNASHSAKAPDLVTAPNPSGPNSSRNATVIVHVFGRTDVGRTREHNED